MYKIASFALLLSATFGPLGFSSVAATSVPIRPHHVMRSSSENSYKHAHSLGDDYKFDSGSGWRFMNVSDSKYATRTFVPPVHLDTKRGKSGGKKPSVLSSVLGASVSHLIDDAWNGLKGLGGSSTVKITWYTGQDLKNPSCWPDTKWAPSDDSFACALTLEGWGDRPKCFKFLEVCNGPKKCVFVRVVDTCAGCAPGSKHVDLTKAAFSALADINEGVLMVQMREATEPKEWYEDLWGPKAG